jgi:hypothetical protein
VIFRSKLGGVYRLRDVRENKNDVRRASFFIFHLARDEVAPACEQRVIAWELQDDGGFSKSNGVVTRISSRLARLGYRRRADASLQRSACGADERARSGRKGQAQVRSGAFSPFHAISIGKIGK